MRLSQVSRKLNIGKNTIIEFLAANGFEVEDNPNYKINAEQLNLLAREFADSALDKEEASSMTIGTKYSDNIVIDTSPDSKKTKEADEEEQFLVTSSHIDKEEVATESPKLKGLNVVGKIDLGNKEIKEEKPVESQVEQESKPELKTDKQEEKQEEKIIKKEPEETPAETPAETPEKESAEEQKTELKAPTPDIKEKTIDNENLQVEDSPIIKETSEKEPTLEDDKKTPPVEELIKPNTEEKQTSNVKTKSGVIEAKAKQLKGLKVVGKIELPKEPSKKTARPVASSDEKGRKKKKRRRLDRTVNKKVGERHKGRVERKPRVKKEEPTEKEIQEKIKATLAKLSGANKSAGVSRAKYRKEKRGEKERYREQELIKEQEDSKILKLNEFISANDLASMMNVSVNEVISTCMNLGMFVSINQRLDAEALTIIADEFGFDVTFVSEEDSLNIDVAKDKEEDLTDRAPIVTIMGHVDHGKTSLLDYIRKEKVTEGEVGGITQHIGAYDVTTSTGKRIAFLDTPGHEAFTAMRARGAKLTDIVVVVIAADDNVMPQTKEAINHAQLADVPIIIAINKIDKPNANPDKIREELSKINILLEEWGGKYQSQEISAKTGQGVDDLLEKILLEAELLELKANSNKPAIGTVVEAELDKGRGYVTTILVQGGTLKVGDILLAGAHHGKVKAMFDHLGRKLDKVGPATPVLVLGLDGAPNAGDNINVMNTEREARELANKREQLIREQNIRVKKHITLDEIGRRLSIGNFRELNIIIKGDVDGSVEALGDSLLKLSTEEVQVNIIHKAIGQISESDVLLASASDAIIVGFQVRPSATARKLAEQEEIEVRLYSVIYDAINEIKDAMEGMLAPEIEEVITANVEVREVYKISKVGSVAGCMVTEGTIKRKNKIRLIRDGIVVYSGEINALKRFKEDVNEVKTGFECGLSIKNFHDIKVGDIVEGFEQQETKRKL